MKLKSAFLVFFCSLTLLVNAQSITLVNPIMKGFYPDPSIVQVGPDYYLVNSTFSYFPGLPILHSRDLKNWEQIGSVIDRPSQMDFMGERLTRGLFAPGISYYKGVFYVTCTDIDNDGNFVSTATNPAGPWSNPVKIPQVRGIDPSIYFDEETDKAYIIYNSDAPDNKPLYSGHRTIRMYEFDYKNLKVTGEERQLVNGGVDLSKKPVWIEGPHIMKRNGWYFLYAAEGGTSVNHSEVILRSKNVWGPYVPYEGNPILTQRELPADRKNPITSAGHAQFLVGPDGKDYMIYLAVRPYEGDYYNTGRETFIAPVTWTEDGWPMAEHGENELKYFYEADYKEVKLKNALPQNGNFEYTLKLKKGLSPELLFMRTIDKSSYTISGKGLTINLKPETVMDLGNPSFVGKRQQHLYSMAETEIDFTPDAEHEKAGLTILQNEDHFYFLSKSVKVGQPVIELYQSVPGKKEMELLTSAPLLKSGKLKLRIESFGDYYNFSFAEKGSDFKLLKDHLDARFLSTKTAGGFIGCLYGLYGTSSGESSANKATFKYLKYKGDDPVYR
ncbi:glycoside hydrolase family 43 protein [Jiulongibacter sediminis]|uniref:Xylan 1,4-beta-xylosidase n=1 Tax=Jiulongibacter sediminis TaxID=1605367 RepID=A0A0P7C392_9BACT|nr:glycoside hydrolase family 43 protein [Jiulongibacter sediminis]KPM48715.1 xylan 1,4-beta-xylosidase [Jiulongibacter sediminis]TBX25251.1 xylan 1,4-beta-xylosidase [Jiulongibacter sediminis]